MILPACLWVNYKDKIIMKMAELVNKKKWLTRILLFTITGSFPSTCPEKTNNIFILQKHKVHNTNTMKRILLIGIDPKTIDFSSPDLVPGLTIEKVEMGMKTELEKLDGLGYKTEVFLFGLKETDVSKLIRHLKNAKYDGIVIGAGVRVPQNTFILFERIINAVHENARESKIMFNTLPTNTAEAVQRWL